jgi:hypothetical protein
MARNKRLVLSIIALVAMTIGGCGATQHQDIAEQANGAGVAESDQVQNAESSELLEPWAVPTQEQRAEAPVAAQPTEPAQPAPAEAIAAAQPAPAAAPQPAAAPENDVQQPAAATGEDDENMLSVRRLVVARGIENREPVDEAVEFNSVNEPLFAFLELANEQPESQNVVVSFEREDGTKVRSISLEVPAQVTRWRTWARCDGIDQQGSWNVVARTPDGQLLAQGAFSVTAGAPADAAPAQAAD